MLNLRHLIAIIALSLTFSNIFAQKFDTKSYDISKKINAIERSENKTAYLQAFLKQISQAPKQYYNASKLTRDSVNTHHQMDYNVLSLSLFKVSKDKNTINIKDKTSKAYTLSLQMIHGGVFSAANQLKIEKYIREINVLLDKKSS